MDDFRRGKDKLEVRKWPIARLLKDELLSVPIYQRSYSWQSEQLTDYWTDLSGALSQSTPAYFLGTIVVTREGDQERLNVVDGQQRLATTAMLIAAIRDAYLDGNLGTRANTVEQQYLMGRDLQTDAMEPHLRLNAEDDAVFAGVILPRKEEKQKIPINRGSHSRMAEAAAFFRTRVSETVSAHGSNWQESLYRWLKFLSEDVLVILVEVEDEAEAFTIFETLNDRGLDLTIADLVKNHLFRLAGSRNVASVNSSWTSATAILDATGDPKIFTNFLRQYWSSRYGVVRERDLFKQMRDLITTPASAVAFVNDLHEAARLYAALLNSSHDYWLDFGTATRTHIDTLIRFGIEQNRPMLLAAMQHFQKAELKKLIKASVAWAVRGQVTRAIGGGTTERAYSDAGVNIRSGNSKTAQAVYRGLMSIIPSDKEFESAFASLIDNRAKFDRYYLLELEIFSRQQQEPEFVPNRDEGEVNLEHIFARNADISEWPLFSTVEPEDWIWRLGNLVLLQKSQNERLGNDPFSSKKSVLARSQLLLTNEAGQVPDWSPANIEARQAKLAQIAVRAWRREP